MGEILYIPMGDSDTGYDINFTSINRVTRAVFFFGRLVLGR